MSLPYYPFYWADYSSKTFNLTQGQHGAYMLFMRHIYVTGRPIPHAQRYAIAKAGLEPGSSNAEAGLQQEMSNADFVLNEFFSREGDFWDHPRIREVMQEAQELHEKRVRAGKNKGKTTLPAKAQKSSAEAELEPGSSPAEARQEQPKPKPKPNYNKDSSSNSEVDGEASDSPPEKKEPMPTPDEFAAFWQAYPRRVSKGAARKAWAKAIQKTSPDTLLAAAKAFARLQAGKDEEFIPHAATWLNAERWQDGNLAEPEKPAVALNGAGGFLIEENSPQWIAWVEYRKRMKFIPPTGKPLTDPKTGRKLNGSYFKTEWPPKIDEVPK